MTPREQKLAFHVEMVIWEDLPEGTRLNAAEVERLVRSATIEQRAVPTSERSPGHRYC
jgi:hypothetical protein